MLRAFRHSKAIVFVILECGVRTVGKNYLIVAGCRDFNFAYINIEVLADTERAFLIICELNYAAKH